MLASGQNRGFTQQHFPFRRESVAGFTLLELVTVIAIIGILSSIVMVSLGTAREKARDGRRIAEVKNLQLALNFYFEVNQRYPTPTEFTTPNLSLPQVSLSPVYITTLPKDPLTGSNYRYSSSGAAPQDYHLGASLEDSGNNELKSDANFNSASAGWTSGFDGLGRTCFDPADPPDGCYDLKAQ